MSKRVKLPADAKPKAQMKTGKDGELVNPKKSRSLRAALVTTYTSGRDRYAIFLMNR